MYDPTKQLESEIRDDEVTEQEMLAGIQWAGGVVAAVALACALIALWGA